jgi:hypothetical protein
MNPPDARHFRIRLTNLNVQKIDAAEVFIDFREAENLNPKNLTDEFPSLQVPSESPPIQNQLPLLRLLRPRPPPPRQRP